jgi:hypothetical protein
MSQPITIQVLERARLIVADPTRWTRGTFARTKTGRVVSTFNDSAYKFCAMGALLLAAFELTGDAGSASQILEKTAKVLSPTGSLTLINDYQGHAAVLDLFDRTLASLRG